MKTSDCVDKIAPALLAAQKAIGNAKKGSLNPHFKNRYADLSSVIEAVKDGLNENGIAFVQTLSEVPAGTRSKAYQEDTHEKGGGGERKITHKLSEFEGATCAIALTTRLLHASGQWIEDTAHAPVSKQDPQGVGSATTYLRRYSLAAICGITQEDDDGEGASHRPPSTKTTVSAATKEQVAAIAALDATRVAKALAHYGAASAPALTEEQAAAIITRISAS